MKTKQLLLSFISALLVGGAAIFFLNDGENTEVYNRTYQARSNSELNSDSYGARGAAKWISERTVNPATGTISKADYELASKTMALSLEKSRQKSRGESFDWKFVGPDNVGGRTRAFLVDNRDNKTLWAGGVAGGLWISKTNGQDWKPAFVKGLEHLSISSICQDAEGTIYFGTGEVFAGVRGINSTSTGFEGDGVWKSTDGVTFEQVVTKDGDPALGSVNEIIYSEKNNKLYLATTEGLFESSDKGATWANPFLKGETSVKVEGFIKDVAVSSDGTIYFTRYYLGESEVYVCKDGVHAVKSDDFDNNIVRIEFATAPSDPDYVYALCAYNDYSEQKYFNLYRTTDGGSNWTSLITKHTPSINVFGGNNQGYYDNTIAVYPDDKEKVLLGGIDLWTWSDQNKFEQVSYWLEFAGQKYVHADQHGIVFHPDYKYNKTLYVTNDGGIFASSDGGIFFRAINKNYGVTQYYDIDCGPKGQIIGGCQDNGSPYMDMEQKTDLKSSFEMSGGDGGYSVASELYPGALFTTIYYSELIRSNENGAKATLQRNPFDEDTKAQLFSNNLKWGNPFVTPIDMYESFDFKKSKNYIPFVVDTVFNILPSGKKEAIVDFPAGYTFIVKSLFLDNKKFEYVLTQEDIDKYGTNGKIRIGDTIPVREKFHAVMAIGANSSIYISRKILDFKTAAPYWDIISAPEKREDYIKDNALGIRSAVTHLKWSNDGDALYAVGNGYDLYRFTGLANAYSTDGEAQVRYDKRDIMPKEKTNVLSKDEVTLKDGKVSYTDENGASQALDNISEVEVVSDFDRLTIQLTIQEEYTDCDTTKTQIFSENITGMSSQNKTISVYDFDYSYTTADSSMVKHFTNVLSIDTANASVKYKDEAGNCQVQAGIVLDSISNFSTISFDKMYYTIMTADQNYNGIINIDTISNEHFYVYNFFGADTSYVMGEMGDDMVWRKAPVNTLDQIQSGQIFSAPGQITSISTHPNDVNKVLITVGGYGPQKRVYYTENALDANPNFVSVSGNLPAIPAFSSLIADSSDYVFVGTEQGVFYTDKLEGESTKWVKEESIPSTPVFSLVQQIQPNGYVPGVCPTGVTNSGMVYAGTYGLGVWSMDKFLRPNSSVPEKLQKEENLVLNVYPNPATDRVSLNYKSEGKEDVAIEVYSITGQLVYNTTIPNQGQGAFTQDIPVENYAKGVYVVKLQIGNVKQVGKFIKE